MLKPFLIGLIAFFKAFWNEEAVGKGN